jgi:hypothetical protein
MESDINGKVATGIPAPSVFANGAVNLRRALL